MAELVMEPPKLSQNNNESGIPSRSKLLLQQLLSGIMSTQAQLALPKYRM